MGLLGTAMCVGEFSTTRRPDPQGTVGEEVFRVICERVSVGESPRDVDFRANRPFCTGLSFAVDGGLVGDAGTSAALIGPKVRALSVRRRDVVTALDRAIPRDLYTGMDTMLVQLLPLYGTDNGTDAGTIRLLDGGRAVADDLLPRTTRGLSILLNSIAADSDATSAFARISRHQGYRPPRVALGLTRNLLSYPRVGEVLDTTLALFREEGGGHPAGAGNEHFNTLLDVLRGELANSAPSQDPSTGTVLDATMDLLFREDPALATGRERPLVRRDPRGMPVVQTGPGNAMPAPFTDSNGDGLADAAEGRFVDSAGQPIVVPSPFPANEAPDGMRDALGRAVNPEISAPMFRYVDLDQTVMGQLMRDALPLVDPDRHTALRLLHGASVLFGSRMDSSRDYMLRHACAGGPNRDGQCAVPAVNYRGYDPNSQAPLLDLVHAIGTFTTSRDLDIILQTVEALMTNHEGPLARSLAAMLEIDRVADMHPESVMDNRSNIWDDVMDVARRIAQTPGLLEDVLDAVANPATQNLGRAFSNFTRYRDRIEPVWTTSQQNASLASRTLTVPVDRSRPDTQNIRGGADDNRSLFQRFLHLMHDMTGVRMCNREGGYVRVNSFLRWPITGGYRECELIDIPDAAVIFLQAIDGSARIEMRDSTLPAWLARVAPGTVDSMLEDNSGITGFDQTPTPEAMARFVFQPDTLRTEFMRVLIDPMRTRDGLDVRQTHPATLFMFETNGFYNAIRPLVHAFVSHGPESARLFADLVSAMHMHWPTDRAGQYQRTSPGAALYNTMDGASRYEPILVEALAGDLIAAGGDLVRAANTINAGSGRTGRDAVAALIRALVDPNALTGIAYRDGRTTTTRSDGTTPVARPSLYYLFADAMNAIDAVFASAPSEQDSWVNARSHLVDTFLTVDAGGTSAARFRNRGLPVVGRLLVRWLRDRVAAHRAVGDVDPWARGLSRRLGETASGPVFGPAIDVLLDIYNDVPARAAAAGLLNHLLDDSENTGENSFGTTLTAAADLIQILRMDADIDPILHVLSGAFQRRMRADESGVNPPFLREEVVPTTLRFLDRARDFDSDRVLDSVLRNLVQRPANPLLADEPLVVIGDAIAETHRQRPGVGGVLNANDFAEMFRQVAEFFSDNSRGMEQFYYIVNHRRLPPTPRSN